MPGPGSHLIGEEERTFSRSSRTVLSRVINISVGVTDRGLGSVFGISIQSDAAEIEEKAAICFEGAFQNTSDDSRRSKWNGFRKNGR